MREANTLRFDWSRTIEEDASSGRNEYAAIRSASPLLGDFEPIQEASEWTG